MARCALFGIVLSFASAWSCLALGDSAPPPDLSVPAELESPSLVKPLPATLPAAGAAQIEQPQTANQGGRPTETIRERYADGSVKIERQVAQDTEGNYQNHGSFTMYDPTGRILRAGQYRDGKLEGRWVRNFLAGEQSLFGGPYEKQFKGPFVSEADFHQGKLNGAWTIRTASGQKIVEWNFADGVRQGKSTWWYPNGEVRREAGYKGGDPNGECREYSPDGQVSAVHVFVDGSQLQPAVGWHSREQKSFEGGYLVSTRMSGVVYDWWNGTVTNLPDAAADARLKHGRWTGWYPNGQVQVVGTYERDVPVGTFTWWYDNGQKQAEGEVRGGDRSGKWVTWYSNGQKESEGTYTDGVLSGRWSRWSEDGKLVEILDGANAAPVRQAQKPKSSEPRSLLHDDDRQGMF
jgi:antitoxin component YwqK of YwqJK toxin-antitoxin module